LLEAGADVNAPFCRYKGITALQGAAAGGHVSVTQRLIEAGAELDAVGSRYNGGTALWLAAGAGHVGTVEVLLEAGADANVMSGNQGQQCTALQIARRNGREGTADFLGRRQTQ
jgi:ankyrin repeat protein